MFYIGVVSKMKKYVDFVFKNKKALFVVFIILNLVSIYGITRVKLNTDFSLFSTNDSIYEQRLAEMEDTFGSIEQMTVLIEHDAFTNDIKDDFILIQQAFTQLDHVRFVEGVTPETINLGGIDMSTSDIDATQLETFYFTKLDEFSPMKLIDGKYYSSFTLIITEDFSRSDLKSVEKILDDYDYTFYIAGDIYNQFKVIDYILTILLILPPLTIVVILSVFRWQIGAFKPTILSVLPAAIGSIWTFGIIGFLGNEISILTAVVPIFIIVIGSADGLHFTSHFQEALMEGLNRREAMTRTLKVVGIPMIITTLTSMAGFLSLLSIDTSSIIDLSVFATVGIFLAGIATWYVLPLILSNDIDVLPKHHKEKKINISKGLKKVWGLPSLVATFLLIVVSAFFIPNINNEFNMLSLYKSYTVVSKNAEKLQEVNGGSIPLYIEIEPDDQVISLASLDQVDQFVSQLESLEEVDHIMNPYRMLEILYNMQYDGDIPSNFVLQAIYQNVSLAEDNIFNNMVNVDENKIRLLVFPSNMQNATLGVIEDQVDSSGINANITGVQYLLRDLNVSISSMQINSILLALGVVLLMLCISLRSIKIALLSIIPIMVTVVAIYGVMGMTGIPLNITTVIIFSISIGVGIDYAVHYSSVYKMYLNETKDSPKSAQLAFKNVSRHVIANALGISLGLSVLMLSPLTIHLNVSILMWVGMIVSVFVTLTFLPFIFSIKKHETGENND